MVGEEVAVGEHRGCGIDEKIKALILYITVRSFSDYTRIPYIISILVFQFFGLVSGISGVMPHFYFLFCAHAGGIRSTEDIFPTEGLSHFLFAGLSCVCLYKRILILITHASVHPCLYRLSKEERVSFSDDKTVVEAAARTHNEGHATSI